MKTRYTLMLTLLILVVLVRPVVGETDTNERIRELEARVALLEAMVEVRDRRIAELQQQLGVLQDDAEPTVPEDAHDVSGDDSSNDAVETPDDSEEADTEGVLTVEDFYQVVKRYGAKGLTIAEKDAIVAELVGREFWVTAKFVTAESGEADSFVVKLIYESRATFTVRGPDQRVGGLVYPGKVLRKVPKRVVRIDVTTQDPAVLDFLCGEELEVRGTIILFSPTDEYVNAEGECVRRQSESVLKRRAVFIRGSDGSFTRIEDE